MWTSQILSHELLRALRIRFVFASFAVGLAISLMHVAYANEATTDSSIGGHDESQLAAHFRSPPRENWPGVYWYFMDGNQSREEMVKDLEAMADVGIGAVIFLEVNIGVPRGPVNFMSQEWQENFAFAVKTAENLGIRVILGTGPGWAGSGGPWVGPDWSMQHLTGSSTQVSGPGRVKIQLEAGLLTPNTFAGMSDDLAEVRANWFEDVVVLAFPTIDDVQMLENFELKALKETKPYSIWKDVPRYIPWSDRGEMVDGKVALPTDQILDISDKMDSSGELNWDVPAGDWTIVRFVSRSTGQTTRPAPVPGHGFETDKFAKGAFRRHWENFQAVLLEQIDPGRDAGLTQIHLDSWEMSSQNWTHEFRDAFVQRRGYDPQPYYPTYLGYVVGSKEQSERFLWDLRKTSQELILENYVSEIRDVAHEHGMIYSNQPYDMNPAGDIDLGSIADIPSCEFWDHRNSDRVDTLYSCLEAASIANTLGKPVLQAEAFTSVVPLRFHSYPAQMKNQTDWALAMGVNQFVFHTYQHQPLGDAFKPGMSMGPHGLNWHRNQTWWEMLGPYHEYIARASYLLRQGQAVADILYLTPEGVPHIFLPPADALKGQGVVRDKRGYSFDAVSPRLLKAFAKVEGGKVVFENGAAYSVLVLPDVKAMTPETLELIATLIADGAIVVGNPPTSSPSLENFPVSDQRVGELTAQIWGVPNGVICRGVRKIGEGKIYFGIDRYQAMQPDNLYPTYEEIASILREEGVVPDLVEPEEKIRFSHRRTERLDIYFVSNRSEQIVESTVTFRDQTSAPELWNPVAGDIRSLPAFEVTSEGVGVPLRFSPHESYFIVFDRGVTAAHSAVPMVIDRNFPSINATVELLGKWYVRFEKALGGPGEIVFPQLTDWATHETDGIKYYSGPATYTLEFEFKQPRPGAANEILLDLGEVREMARAELNGVDLGIAWSNPWRLSTKGALRDGINTLTVKVANSWENRLIGDSLTSAPIREVVWANGLLEGAPQPAGEYTFTTYSDEASDFGEIEIGPRKLQRSGLMGPVKLIFIDQDRRDD